MQAIARLEQWLPRRKIYIFGKDSLMMSSLPYYTLALLTASALFTTFGDPQASKFKPFLFISIVYAIFPILDELFSLDERNPTVQERKKLEKDDSYFRMALYAAMILSWASNIKSLYISSVLQIGYGNLFRMIGIIFILSNLYAVQFVVAHEVMHKPGKFYRVLATLHMVNLYYPHFTYHHLYRHHYQVATPEDPASATKGQNVYKFIINCVLKSWIGVFNDEKKVGKYFFTNYAVLSLISSIAFALGIYTYFGLQPMIMHSIMAFIAIFYLEAINYVEHYGLIRKKLLNGEYEKVTIFHSWNAPHRFTNYLLFKLQRHSDHHENSSKPYQTLDSLEESPFMPHGYNLMIIMAFFPKVWFRIMDPLVDAYKELDIEKKERIDPKIMETAKTETRKFLIELAVTSVFLFCLTISGIL